MPDLVEAVVEDSRWRTMAISELATRAANAALQAVGLDPEDCEISLLAADDARIAELNATFRGKPAPTNVLSWPSGEKPRAGEPRFLGDIALAYDTCLREAEARGVDPADHVTHLVAHGVLHLVGYDHETDAEADVMEALETKILERLGLPDPYRFQGRP
jgi:probable rRNA maturation factor